MRLSVAPSILTDLRLEPRQQPLVHLHPGHRTRLLLQSYTTHVVFGCARDRFLIPMHAARTVLTPPLCKSADGLL